MVRYEIEYLDSDGVWRNPGAREDCIAPTREDAKRWITSLLRQVPDYRRAEFRIVELDEGGR